MKTFLKWLLLAPLILIGLAFAVINRHFVTVVIDPFNGDIPGLSFTMPLFLALFIAGGVGVVLGSFVTWLSQGRYRRSARDMKDELANVRLQSDRLRVVPRLSAPDDANRTAA